LESSSHKPKGMFYLPIELWLHVFKFTDNETFNIIMKVLYRSDFDFAERLLGVVCRDIVKFNHKILLMNNLLKEPQIFMNKQSYMGFKSKYFRESYYSSKSRLCLKYRFPDLKEAYIYKKHIHSNLHTWLDKDFHKIFNNLTYCRGGIEHSNITDKETLSFYNNKIPIGEIIRLTHGMDISLCFHSR
jgi:hypothetical protein